MTVSERELPKAYLRLDPDIDQKHPDNLAEFIRLMCASARQRPRGRFANRGVLEALFGKPAVVRFYARGDVIGQPDGSVWTAKWDDWQEGDMTVAERVRRTRQKKADALLDRYTGVTETFPDPLPIPLPPSYVLTSSVLTSDSQTKGESVPSGVDLAEVIGWLEMTGAKRPWTDRPGSKAWDTLEANVRDFGTAAVIAAMGTSPEAHPNARQLIYHAEDVLHPYSKGSPEDAAAKRQRVRGAAEAEARRKRREEMDAAG